MARLAQICILTICWLGASLAHPHPYAFPAQQQVEDTRQLYQPLRQYQLPASTRLLPNNVNDGVRYGQQQPLVYMMPQQAQQYLYQDQGAGQLGAVPSAQIAQGQVPSADQAGYVESFFNNFAGGYYPFQAADNRPVAPLQPQPAEQDKPERLQAAPSPLLQQQLYLEQQAAAQAQMQLLQEEADRQKYMLQYYQQRPNSNFVYYSLPQQQQQQVAPQAALADRTQNPAFRPVGLNFQRLQQIRSGQEQNNASSELQESQEATQAPQSAEEVGPSIAQAKPQAISVAGPGGVAAAAPVGTAVVGPGGMALSAPSATALAGTRPKPGQTPTASKIRHAVQYL